MPHLFCVTPNLKPSIDRAALDTAKNYYDCFNNKDWQGMLALTNIKRQPDQGDERIGIELFTAFLQMMDECYEETLTEIVLLSEPSNNRVAAEFIVRKF